MAGVPVLVLANKQDLPQSFSTSEIAKTLGLSCISNRQWRIHSICATEGQGLHEAVLEFSDMVKNFHNHHKD